MALKKSDLRKAWRENKKSAGKQLRTEIKAKISEWAADTTLETLNVTSEEDFKKKKALYLNEQVLNMGFGSGLKSKFEFSEMFPKFDDGFGKMLDTYCKAADKNAKDKGTKRGLAAAQAQKYKKAVDDKIKEVLKPKGFTKTATELQTCSKWLDDFIQGRVDHA